MKTQPAGFIPFDPDAHVASGPVMLSDVIMSQVVKPEPEPEAEKGLSRPLSNFQKWQLSALAGKAWDALRANGECVGEDLKSFRQRVAVAACGMRISGASLGHYKLIQAAFLALMGRAQEAARARAKAVAAPVEIARHKLWALCAAKKFPAAYAEGLCWRFYKCRVAELADAKRVWSLFYTVQNNANARDGKGQAASRFKSRRAKQKGVQS